MPMHLIGGLEPKAVEARGKIPAIYFLKQERDRATLACHFPLLTDFTTVKKSNQIIQP